MKILRWIGFSALLLAVLILLIGFGLSKTIHRYQPEIAAWVERKLARQLSFEGEIELSLFPQPVLKTGPIRLSEYRSEHPFARLAKLEIEFPWRVLWQQTVSLDRAQIHGLEVNLVRDREGKTNIDDLLPDPAAPPRAFDLRGLNLTASKVTLRDEVSGYDFSLHDVQFSAARLADGEKTPLELRATLTGKTFPESTLSLSTQAEFDRHSKHTALSSLRLTWQTGAPLSMEAQLSTEVEFNWHTLAWSVRALHLNGHSTTSTYTVSSAGITGQGLGWLAQDSTASLRYQAHRFDLKLPELTGEGGVLNSTALELSAQNAPHYQVNWVAACAVDLAAGRIELREGLVQGQISSPRQHILRFAGKSKARLTRQQAEVDFQGKLQQASAKGNLTLHSLSPPQGRFALELAELDLDHWLPQQSAASVAQSKSDSAFKGMVIGGVIRVGELRYGSWRSKKVALQATVRDGQLALPKEFTR